MINHFNFTSFGKLFLITNDLGYHALINKNELHYLITDKETQFSAKKIKELQEKHFILNNSINNDNLIYEYQKKKCYLLQPTSLHILVLTTKCNMNCIYCQASAKDSINEDQMTNDIAKQIVDFILTINNQNLTIEFQGGEPLLKFETIKTIIEYVNSKEINNKNIYFSLVSNLTLLNDEMLSFFKKNNVTISTSLDGDKFLQSINRKSSIKHNFELLKNNIIRLQNNNIPISAIQTTTKYSFSHEKEMIDTYINFGLKAIFIRPLTRLGKASKNWNKIGYSAKEFIDYYKKCLEYIINLNINGVYLKEIHATIILTKILKTSPINYMELRSPCGAAIGQMAYSPKGEIFSCDEARMLSKMGDDSFKLGTIAEPYTEIMQKRKTKAIVSSSILESIPECCDCVYSPYCGTCPVINYFENNNIISLKPNSFRCQIYKGIIEYLFKLLYDNNDQIRKILVSWVSYEK